MRAFRALIERQIHKAISRGALSGLDGEGKPLPQRPEDAVVDPAMAAGMRIMAQAGVRPQEFDLKEKLEAERAEFATLSDPQLRKSAMARIADLEMRYNMARDARKSFFR